MTVRRLERSDPIFLRASRNTYVGSGAVLTMQIIVFIPLLLATLFQNRENPGDIPPRSSKERRTLQLLSHRLRSQVEQMPTQTFKLRVQLFTI